MWRHIFKVDDKSPPDILPTAGRLDKTVRDNVATHIFEVDDESPPDVPPAAGKRF